MISIVLATDDNFVQHCSVVIASILANNTDVSFYIFTEGLKDENVKILMDLAKENGGELHVCIVDSQIVSQFPMPPYMSNHISIATYYRLFVEWLLPKDVDRVIYMDCDIVVRGSLDPLWRTDMSDMAIGAVYQNNEWAIDNNSFERLGYSKEYGYFNAGVLLINLDYWRKHGVTDELMAFIQNNFDKIHSHDQDVLNAVLHGKVKPLSYTWNCLPSFFEKNKYTFPSCVNYTEIIAEPIVIHYVFKPKPWQFECRHPFKDDYFKYLDNTPFRGWRPKRTWRGFWEYVLKPKSLMLLVHLDVLKIRKLFK